MTKNSEKMARCADAEEPIAGREEHLAYLQKRELLLKIIFIGDPGVGKTSIIRRYSEGTYLSDSYAISIGADFANKIIDWDEETRINLQLWDIAGHERFGCLTGVYYRHAKAAAIVFDLTRPETFNSVEKWLFDLRRKVSLPENVAIPVVLLANKGDITIETLPKEIVNFCVKYNIVAWFITSAKENVHIDEAMTTLVNAAKSCFENIQISTVRDEGIVKLDETTFLSPSDQKSCCQR